MMKTEKTIEPSEDHFLLMVRVSFGTLWPAHHKCNRAKFYHKNVHTVLYSLESLT